MHAQQIVSDAQNGHAQDTDPRDEEAKRTIEALRTVAHVQLKVRAVSHHGSDCSVGCDGSGYCRALTLTRYRVYPFDGSETFDFAVLEDDDTPAQLTFATEHGESVCMEAMAMLGEEAFG